MMRAPLILSWLFMVLEELGKFHVLVIVSDANHSASLQHRKTQLATKYIYDRKLKKPEASVFWVSARSDKDIEAGFRECAKMLSRRHNTKGAGHACQNLTAAAEPAAATGSQPDGVDILKSWMLSPGHEDWLLVLDNFDDIKVKTDRFLPTGASGSVLITTRDRNAIGSVATSGFHLTAMDLLDAERLFLRTQNLGADPHLQESTSGSEHQILKEILEELQCFPLAIDQAASFIRENSPMTLREYQTYLKPRSVDRELLLRFKKANPTYPESVMTTWEISLRYIERDQPVAGRILQLLGFLDHSDISETLLTSVTEQMPWIFDTNLDGKRLRPKYQTQVAFLKRDVHFRVAIGTLLSLSLIQRHVFTLRVHPLVHEWIRVRLNPEPEKQANFSIVSALLLYQYLPSEIFVWLSPRPNFNSLEVQDRMDQVKRHIRPVLTNLTDYAIHSSTASLECFVLCEILILASFSTHLDLQSISFQVPSALLKDLDCYIEWIMNRIADDQKPFARFIHRVILWLKGSPRQKQKDQTQSVRRIADSFESLQANCLQEKYPDDFFLLLAHSIVELCDAHRHTLRQRLGLKSHTPQRFEEKKEQRQRTIYRLLTSLRNLLSSIEPLSNLLRRTRLAITIRLLRIMTPEEFATQNFLDIEKSVSSEEIDHLDYNEKADYLCLLAQLLWDYQGPKEFLGLQRVLSAVIRECSAMWKNQRRSTILQRERASIHAMSRSGYISSSFGRELNPEEKYIAKSDIITPLDYIWTITPMLAETTSDPRQQWRISCVDDSRIEYLNSSQRRWSLNLLSSIRKLYKRCCAERGLTSALQAAYFSHFKASSVRYHLINIYANLEDWQKLQRVLVVLLQCDEVLRFCNSSKLLPWEYDKETGTQEDRSSPPTLHTPQHDSRQTSWLLLATRPFKAAKDLVTGQVSPTHSPSKVSAEASLQEPEAIPHNRAAEIIARLEAAADHRKKRAQLMKPYDSDYEPRDNRSSKCQSLDLPDSVNCIAAANVGDAIAKFYTLAQKLQLLNEAEASDLWLKIMVVANLPSESPAKYLGNFEIIHQLAQRFSDRFSNSMYVDDRDDLGDLGNTMSLDEEMEEEEEKEEKEEEEEEEEEEEGRN